MASSELLTLLRRRCSVRSFRDEPVPPEIVQIILEAGRLSPSGGNEQSWRFGVITDPGLIRGVAALACGQRWLAAAPLLIVLCTVHVPDQRGGRDVQRQRFPRYDEAIRDMDEGLYRALDQEEHQTKIAGAHMELAAVEQGLGTCWVSRFDVYGVARLLGLPEDCLPSELLAVGRPAGERRPEGKKTLDELVFYDSWTDPE